MLVIRIQLFFFFFFFLGGGASSSNESKRSEAIYIFLKFCCFICSN